jgi:hypothetical protein
MLYRRFPVLAEAAFGTHDSQGRCQARQKRA